MNAPRLLERYLLKKGLSYEAFAQRIGTCKSLVRMWVTRERSPGLDYAYAIEEATRRFVPHGAWRSPRRRRRRVKRAA